MSSTASDAPFDPLAYPDDLRAAQRRLTELYDRLHAHQRGLPWAREAHPGWAAEEERGRQRPGRPETSGWEADAAAEYDQLWEKLREAAVEVQCHDHWRRCGEHGIQGPAIVDARQALKHAEDTAPVAA
jgi:hypothetical protein